MSDTISLDFIGTQLRAIQAEQRNMRMDNDLLRQDLALKATREDLYNAIATVSGRMGTFETEVTHRLETFRTEISERMDAMDAEIGRLAAAVGRNSAEIGSLSVAMSAGFDRLAAEIARMRSS